MHSDAPPFPSAHPLSPTPTTAIIVAAGGSTRMGTDKLLLPLGGQPLLQWTLQAFVDCADVVEIILICPAERAAALTLPPHCRRIDGGAQRQDSVWAGLQAATQPLVAVHDGARPLIHPSTISQVIAMAAETGAAALAKPVTETLKRTTLGNAVLPDSPAIDREQLWSMETPQVFRTTLLRAAYQQVLTAQRIVTDEVSAVQLSGHPVQLVLSPSPNLKITYPSDLPLAEWLLDP